MAVSARDAIPNVDLYNLRDAKGLSQQDLADCLNDLAARARESWSCTAQTVSRWERGVVERPDPLARRLLAEFFDVSIEELGFTRPRSRSPHRSDPIPEDLALVNLAQTPQAAEPRVDRSQGDWRAIRRALNSHRHELSDVAARLYDDSMRLGTTGLLQCPSWIPTTPVDLAGISLDLHASGSAELTGTEPEAAGSLPLASLDQRYSRYSHAMRDLTAPKLFDNRLSYRILDVDFTPSDGAPARMRFGFTTYFEMVDVCELLAHETATAHLHVSDDSSAVGHPSWRRLPWRRLLGDPFDPSRRPILPSINTLTIRRSKTGSPSMVLHQRDSASVAVAGGLLHVMPAGVFQPSSVLPAAQEDDFDMWRNVMREYSEEFLGNPEHGGDGTPIDYGTTEPFVTLDAARRDGRLRIWCMGIAMDALTLACETLTVCVIDDEVYDHVFADMVNTNTEGIVAATTVPFEEHTVRRLLSGVPYRLAPGAAGCIERAWHHRAHVLTP